jgi:DNA polymerase-1
MIRIDEELAEKGYETKMLLQVHDELIFEGPRAEEDSLRAMLRRIMPASLPQLTVPLKIDIKSGRNWADME